MVIKIETTEKIREIGNSHYVNIRKELMEGLNLESGDLVKITIETIENKKKNKDNS